MMKKIQTVKNLSLFLTQALTYLFFNKQANFVALSQQRSKSLPALDPLILEIFEANRLSSAHHPLLYEPVFEHKKIANVITTFFSATHTDIYWGDFVVKQDSSDTMEKIVQAVQMALCQAQQRSKFCTFLNLSQEHASAIEKSNLPLKKYYIGEEWITDVQGFDLVGKSRRHFRNATHSAARHGLRLIEAVPEDFQTINQLISHFSQNKRLSFPRVGAAVVKPYVYHPLLARRVWKVIDAEEKILGAIVAVPTGKDHYFFEHSVCDPSNKYHFLFDWALSAVILQLKAENVRYVSWGKIPHLINENDLKANPDLSAMKLFYQFTKLSKFAQASMNFKRDFQPIIKKPVWGFYNEFNAALFLDVMKLMRR